MKVRSEGESPVQRERTEEVEGEMRKKEGILGF